MRGRLLIASGTFDKTMTLLHDVMHQTKCPPRTTAKLRGKFGHQFRCLEGVGPFLVPFNRFIGGPESVQEWDEQKTITDHLRTTMGSLYRWLPELQPKGTEMWPLEQETLLLRWEQGLDIPGGPLVAVYWGASPLSVGLSIRTRPDQIWKTAGMQYDRATSIITFDSPLEAQVHRESAGGPITLRVLRGLGIRIISGVGQSTWPSLCLTRQTTPGYSSDGLFVASGPSTVDPTGSPLEASVILLLDPTGDTLGIRTTSVAPM